MDVAARFAMLNTNLESYSINLYRNILARLLVVVLPCASNVVSLQTQKILYVIVDVRYCARFQNNEQLSGFILTWIPNRCTNDILQSKINTNLIAHVNVNWMKLSCVKIISDDVFDRLSLNPHRVQLCV